MKVEFLALSPHEALHVAILIEERNARIYESFARMFDVFVDDESRAVARTFREMAEEEGRHRHYLHKRYVERYGYRLASLSDQDVADMIELPRLAEDESFDPENFTRRQALEVALAAEHEARCYYLRLSRLARDGDLRRLYTEFAEMEREHEDFLRRKLAVPTFAGEEG